MILHHYGVSPYSEKIRCLFGYTDMAWQSVVVPPQPPRPVLDPLVGGYRRIPVAQIGADLFCDSNLIAEEIADLASNPQLALVNCAAEIQSFVQHTEQAVFMAVVQSVIPKSALGMLLRRYWPWQIVRLMRDRARVAKTSKAPRLSKTERVAALNAFRDELDARAADNQFLFGDKPTIADFAAYHVVWFADLTRPEKYLQGKSSALAWQARMRAFGHGEKAKIKPAQVCQAARESEPRRIPTTQREHDDIGASVVIRPNDYARDGVTGQLVGVDANRWIIARHTDRFGTLHVHFPARGYELSITGK
ncbi:glutathione S-transferase [Arenicella chitinivorans]|uniref:Glutathione S-transferase n=1 Tax=Arenicella chitinivorans TaxID=1329800 RepID=A0A918RF54_9GAMM|nr:glutathione S-transferase family protein [Arenicella chitinivorans]GGZ96339.1 glutathione S-transferase [Arenicella chitinivorans]